MTVFYFYFYTLKPLIFSKFYWFFGEKSEFQWLLLLPLSTGHKSSIKESLESIREMAWCQK